MAKENKDLRILIRQTINESFTNLEEAQKGKQFDLYVAYTMSQLSPDVPEGKFNDVDIMKEVYRQLKIKLDTALLNQFEYPNFYIVKLGNFVLKTNEGKEKLSFIKKGEENIKYSYPYLYVYHDRAEIIKFGSRFFESDEIILKNAQEFIKNRNINLITKTENGQVIILSDLDKDNIIDLVNWADIKNPLTAPKSSKAKEKNEYRVGQPFIHNLYGKGVISKTKKFGVDETGNILYNITVNFNGKEKTFRVSAKQKAAV